MITKVHGRHGSRWAAVQGLYAWSLSNASIARIEEDLSGQYFRYLPTESGSQTAVPVKVLFDKPYLHELLTEIVKQVSELDELITPYTERELADINPVELAILRVAIYELKEKLETPYRVVINEAILLAKQFGAVDSHKFVNGVLDKAAKLLRERELA